MEVPSTVDKMACPYGYHEEHIREEPPPLAHQIYTKQSHMLSSSTPANHSHDVTDCASPAESRREIETEIDEHTFYDMLEDERPAPYVNKISTPHSPRARTCSLDHILGETKPDDIGNSCETSNDGQPNVGLELEITQRSRTAREGGRRPCILEYDQQEPIQLTTPPDTEMRPRKRSAPVEAKRRASKLGPFTNPLVTKSVLQPTKKRHIEDSSHPRPFPTYRVTTTEQAVKLSKTTLDKLAAFRHDSSAGEQPVDHESFTYTPSMLSEVGSCSKQDGVVSLRSQHALNDQGHFWKGNHRSHDGNSFDAHGHGDLDKDTDEIISRNRIDNVNETQQPLVHDLNQSHHILESDSSWKVRGSSTDTSQYVHEVVENSVRENFHDNPLNHRASRMNKHSELPQESPSGSDYGDLTTDELNALAVTTDHNHVVGGIVPLHTEGSHAVPLDDILQYEARVTRSLQAFHEDRGTITEPLSDSQIEMEAYEEISPPMDSPLHLECFKDEASASLTTVRTELYDMKSGGEKSPHTSEDCSSDEFDEGLNDTDFFAIPLNIVNSHNPSVSSDDAVQFIGSGDGMVSKSQSGSSRNAINKNLDATWHQTKSTQPRLVQSGVRDEYPIEDDLEKALYSLSARSNGTGEDPVLPPNLEHNNSDAVGVYNEAPESSEVRPTGSSASDVVVVEDQSNSPSDESNSTNNNRYTSRDEVSDEEECILIDPYPTIQIAPQSSLIWRNPPVQVSHNCTAVTRQLSNNISHQSENPRMDSSTSSRRSATGWEWLAPNDSHEYQPLKPFARSDFPILTLERSPIIGLSSRPFLRVCFRIGEMLKEGSRCEAAKQNPVMELFTRVISSSREAGTTKQHFQFADMWHDRPPFPTGVLKNYKSTGLAESESRAFLGADEGMMARCLGKIRQENRSGVTWVMDIINIRKTDWEEIRWTKKIVDAGATQPQNARSVGVAEK